MHANSDGCLHWTSRFGPTSTITLLLVVSSCVEIGAGDGTLYISLADGANPDVVSQYVYHNPRNAHTALQKLVCRTQVI